MPTRKNLIAELTKKHKKEQEKEKEKEEPARKVAGKKPKPPSLQGIALATKENELVREFFKDLVEKTNDPKKIESNSRKFGDSGWAGRKKLFNEIFNTLPDNMYQNFIKDFLEQDNSDLKQFFDNYRGIPEVAKAIKENERLSDVLGEIIDEFGEKTPTRPPRIKIDEKGEVQEESDESEEEREKTPSQRKTKYKTTKHGRLVGDIWIDETPPPKRKQRAIKHKKIPDKCYLDFKSGIWLNTKIEKIYLSPVEGTDLSPYILEDLSITKEDGSEWYQANQVFLNLVCGIDTQNGLIYTVQNNDNKSISMNIAYDTEKGWIIQNEEIFDIWKNYKQKLTEKSK